MQEQPLTFGRFTLLPVQRRLLDGEQPVALGSRALDILIALTQRAGQVVGKNELLAQAWPGINVEEANLRVQIAAIRKALGEGGRGGRFIASIPGRGYSFTASVSEPRERAPEEAPSWASQAGALPGQLTSIVGREQLIKAVVAEAARRRLTTLVGPGGIGRRSP